MAVRLFPNAYRMSAGAGLVVLLAFAAASKGTAEQLDALRDP